MPFFKKQSSVSHIIVFLGNPGREYDETRHNVGFHVADVLSARLGVKINRLKFSSLTGAADISGNRVFLMKPQTYMNLSGGALWQAMAFYKVSLDRVIAVADDVSLPVGKLRVRRQGSHGGHNGLRDIAAKCGGDGFVRLKIGVGSPPHDGFAMADWVLSKFAGDDRAVIADAVTRAADALETIVADGTDAAMSKFN